MSNEHEVRALSRAQECAEKILDMLPDLSKPRRTDAVAQQIFAAFQDEHAEIEKRLCALLAEHKGPPEIHLRRRIKEFANDLVNV